MAVAMVLETNNATVSEASRKANVQRTRILQARTVLKYAPDLYGFGASESDLTQRKSNAADGALPKYGSTVST